MRLRLTKLQQELTYVALSFVSLVVFCISGGLFIETTTKFKMHNAQHSIERITETPNFFGIICIIIGAICVYKAFKLHNENKI